MLSLLLLLLLWLLLLWRHLPRFECVLRGAVRLDRVDLHYKCTRVDRQLCAKITTVPQVDDVPCLPPTLCLPALALLLFYLHLISRIISVAKCTRDETRQAVRSRSTKVTSRQLHIQIHMQIHLHIHGQLQIQIHMCRGS